MRKNCAEFWTSGAGGDRRCYLKVRHMHLNQSILNWQIGGGGKLINQSRAIHVVTRGFARDVFLAARPYRSPSSELKMSQFTTNSYGHSYPFGFGFFHPFLINSTLISL